MRRRLPFAWIAVALLVLVAIVVAIRVPKGDGSTAAGVTGSPGPAATSTGPTRSPTSSSPTATASATRTTPSVAPNVPPPCSFGQVRTKEHDYHDWAVSLVDTKFRLPPDYVPPDLESTREAGFEEDLLVRSFVIPDLEELREAAESAGNPVALTAAYRSYDAQAGLFDRRVKEFGMDEALRSTARPGHSEHQLGTTVDFKTPGQPDVNAAWATTPEGVWVHDNAYRYGFVQSYVVGKEDVTCYKYEPWHFRYVGRDMAARVQSSGLTLREYLWRQQASNPG
jgi:D-alanyl-D-alanine carboxypeptidase